MSQSIPQLQNELPKSIQLFSHAPQRRRFSVKSLDPSTVQSADDLPPYLILGDLDYDTFKKTAGGWFALWQGAEHDTSFSIKYLANKQRYEIHQVWCGVEGPYGSFSSKIPLDTIILQALYLQFPSSWDKKAKEILEERFQITYLEQDKESYSFVGIPDGPFRTIAFSVSIKNMRWVRKWLEEITFLFDSRYPLSAEANLIFQAINYVEGKAPEWTTNASVVFNHSLAETGIAPHNFPVKETASDGTAAWTLRRDSYVLFISLPFAGLADLLEKMCSIDGPVRSRTDPNLRIELQPVIMPASFAIQAASLTRWDTDRTTRCLWQFLAAGDEPSQPAADLVQSEKHAEDLLIAAENISLEVTDAIEQIAKRVFRATDV